MAALLVELLKQDERDYSLRDAELLDVTWCVQAGMGAFLYHSVDCLALQGLSEGLYNQLQASYYASVFSAQDQSSALLDVLNMSNESHFSVCVLKGMSVSYQYYEQPNLRLMRDIDLLVSVQDVPKLEAILFRQGYHQLSDNSPSYYAEHHHTMPFYHEKKKVWIEVHVQLFREGCWRSSIPAFSVENIHHEMSPAVFNGKKIKRLSAELQLIYIAAHWVEDFKPQGGLFAIWDAFFLLRQEKNFDWDKVFAWTSESKQLALPVYLLLNNLLRYQLVRLDDVHMGQLKRHCGESVAIRCWAFNKVIDNFYLQQGVYGKFLNEFSLSVLWDEVSKPSSQPYIVRVVWNIMFPVGLEERYSSTWHWRRFKKLLGFS